MLYKFSITEIHNNGLDDVRHARALTELRSFPSILKIFERLVPPFFRLEAPFNQLYKKQQPITLLFADDSQTHSFKTIVVAYTLPPIPFLPRLGLPHSVETGA